MASSGTRRERQSGEAAAPPRVPAPTQRARFNAHAGGGGALLQLLQAAGVPDTPGARRLLLSAVEQWRGSKPGAGSSRALPPRGAAAPHKTRPHKLAAVPPGAAAGGSHAGGAAPARAAAQPHAQPCRPATAAPWPARASSAAANVSSSTPPAPPSTPPRPGSAAAWQLLREANRQAPRPPAGATALAAAAERGAPGSGRPSSTARGGDDAGRSGSSGPQQRAASLGAESPGDTGDAALDTPAPARELLATACARDGVAERLQQLALWQGCGDGDGAASINLFSRCSSSAGSEGGSARPAAAGGTTPPRAHARHARGGRQAAAMVLSLDDPAASSAEVLELELAKLSLEQLHALRDALGGAARRLEEGAGARAAAHATEYKND